LHADRSWIRRRTDRTVILDRNRARWSTELEICLPDFAAPGAATSITLTELPLPLVHKQKRLLTGFSVTTGHNEGISTLTARESRIITAEMVLSEAQQVLVSQGLFTQGFDRSVEWVLLRFTGTAEEGAAAFQWLIDASGAGQRGSTVARDQAEALIQTEFMRNLLKELSTAFPVIALVPNTPGQRDILWVTHDDDTGGRIYLPGGAAASYHAEISCPDGVRFAAATPLVPHDLPDSHDVEDATAGGYWQRTSRDELIAVHVAATRREASIEIDVGRALKVEARGIGTLSRAAAWVTLGIFAGGVLLRTLGVRPQVESAPILVGVASGVVGLLATRGRAPTQREVAAKPRGALTVLSLLIAIAAVALALKFPNAGLTGLAGAGWGWRAAVWCLLGIGAAGTVSWVEWNRRSW